MNSQHFVRVWFIALAAPPDLFRSDYVNIVMTVDGRRNFLFCDLWPLPEDEDWRNSNFINAKLKIAKGKVRKALFNQTLISQQEH
jgi:hypothetical protein